MSSQSTNQNDGQVNERERAVRVFARELNDAAGHNFTESTDDTAPSYTLLPTGTRVNRVFIVGTLTRVNDYDSGFVNGVVNDGHENFRISASKEYRPEAASILKDMDTPTFVGVVGKPQHYTSSDDTERIEIGRLEEITTVAPEERYEWVVSTAHRTRERVEQLHNTTEEDVESGDAPKDIALVRGDTAGNSYEDINPEVYLMAAQQAIQETMM